MVIITVKKRLLLSAFFFVSGNCFGKFRFIDNPTFAEDNPAQTRGLFDITIDVRTSQTTNTNISGTVNVKGTGVILDFTGGGSYTLANNAIVYMNGLHIKGLGATGGGNIIFGNANSALYLTNCILELSGTYTQSQGQIIIEGGCCKVISDTGSKLVVSGSSTSFTVNGQKLIYENRNQLPTYPFQTVSGGTIATTNDGCIISNYASGISRNRNLYANSATGAVNSTDININLSSSETITFFNEDPTVAKTMIFDGNNNSLRFPDNASNSIIVQPKVALTIRNVKFENFDPAIFQLMGSGASAATITFADNVVFEIKKDLSFATGALPLTGTTTIMGFYNSTMTLASQSITFTGASKLLTIKGMKLKYSAYDALKCCSYTSTVALQNSELYMTNTGITIDAGYVQINNTVKICGASETTADATVPLNFTSKGLFTITSGASLEMGYDTVFNYSPNITQDFGIASIQKKHLVFADTSSTLILNKASLNTGTNGLALDHGKVLIKDLVTCTTSATAGAEFELGNNVNLSISAGALFKISGNLKYVTST